jgi:hypothetical protein
MFLVTVKRQGNVVGTIEAYGLIVRNPDGTYQAPFYGPGDAVPKEAVLNPSEFMPEQQVRVILSRLEDGGKEGAVGEYEWSAEERSA